MTIDFGDKHVNLGALHYGDMFQYGTRYCIKGFTRSNDDVVIDVETGEVFHLNLDTDVIPVSEARAVLK